MKIQLPNGCSHSQLAVNPTNWQTKKASISRNWFIVYRFYDPSHIKPKQVMIKGMNAYKTLPERQAETQRLISKELESLQKGHNPFNKFAEAGNAIGFIGALEFAFQNTMVAERTQKDLKHVLSKSKKAINTLGWNQLLISEVSRKHIRLLLDAISNSDDSFNKNRSYLMILFSVLCELEMVQTNYVRDIKKRKVTKLIRQVLTDEERVLVDHYLQSRYPEFHRFLHIFFHSGARISELIRVRESEVDLNKQRFRVLIQKGTAYREVWKTIKNIALPFWEEAMSQCKTGDYLFSKSLKPGPQQIQSYQINKRWYRLVKQKLGVKADFYSLKHLHTTEVVEMLGVQEAAKHNGHTSTAMVSNIYDIRKQKRDQSKIGELNNKFA